MNLLQFVKVILIVDYILLFLTTLKRKKENRIPHYSYTVEVSNVFQAGSLPRTKKQSNFLKFNEFWGILFSGKNEKKERRYTTFGNTISTILPKGLAGVSPGIRYISFGSKTILERYRDAGQRL